MRRWLPRRPRWVWRLLLLGLLVGWYGLHTWLPLHARLTGRWQVLESCPWGPAATTLTLAADGTQLADGRVGPPWVLTSDADGPVLVLAPDAFHGGRYPIQSLNTLIPGVRILTLACGDNRPAVRMRHIGIP